MLHALKHQGPDGVLAELRALREAHPTVAEVATHVRYLDRRRAQLQYPVFQAAGWPIGSGSVESANKLVVEDRLKGAGMHWTDGNVNPMLALRNVVCNDRWDTVWPQVEAAQLWQQAAQRRARCRHRQATPVGRASSTCPSSPPPRPRSAPPTGEQRPAATHPWRRAWSVRQQRREASHPLHR